MNILAFFFSSSCPHKKILDKMALSQPFPFNLFKKEIEKSEKNFLEKKTDEYGDTILIKITKYDLTEHAVYYIKKYGELTHPDHSNDEQNTALMYAIQNKNNKIVSELLNLNKTFNSINNKNKDGFTALMYSIIYSMHSLTYKLMNLNNVIVCQTTLIVAINNNSFGIVKKILENKFMEEYLQEEFYFFCKNSAIFSLFLNLKYKKRNCSIKNFKNEDLDMLNIKKNSGTYGIVFYVCEKNTKYIYAVKKFINSKNCKEIPKDVVKEIMYIKYINKYISSTVKFYGIYIDTCINMIMEKMDVTLDTYFFDVLMYLDEFEKNNILTKIFYKVMRAIYNIHSLGIIHNDLKPNNIMIDVNNLDVKIIDFGMAKFEGSICETEIIFQIKDPSLEMEKYKEYISDEEKLLTTSYESDIYSLSVIFMNLINDDEFKKYVTIDGQTYTVVEKSEKYILTKYYPTVNYDIFYNVIQINNVLPSKRKTLAKLLCIKDRHEYYKNDIINIYHKNKEIEQKLTNIVKILICLSKEFNPIFNTLLYLKNFSNSAEEIEHTFLYIYDFYLKCFGFSGVNVLTDNEQIKHNLIHMECYPIEIHLKYKYIENIKDKFINFIIYNHGSYNIFYIIDKIF